MNLKKIQSGSFLLLFLLISFQCVAQNQSTEIDYELQRIDARHRLFKTKNIWNWLQLDTQTGQVWQVQFSVNEGERLKIPIIKEALVSNSKTGRFALYPTRNMYNFLLLDTEAGKTWQVQWANDTSQANWAIGEKKGVSEWKR